ncbi:SphA family protein [Paraburkholderia sp.]|uniref:SphA family protein n=1 Tax=Paraburkholderia sp. TaxID=1926495 RepID=UPI003D6FF084
MKISFRRVAACAFVAAIQSSAGYAAEGPTFGGPVGGTDIRNAYLPSATGFYFGLVTGYGHSSQLYGGGGHPVNNVNVSTSNNIFAGGILYVYPFKLLGGTVASSLQTAYYSGRLTLGPTTNNVRGFGDLYSDLFSWSRYFGNAANGLPVGLTAKVAYSMIFPTGAYNKRDLTSPGHNTIYYIPNFALTYLTGPNIFGDGTEFSAHIFMDIAGTNNATHYHNGPVFDVDWAISERLARWQFGVTGFYANEMADDEINGVRVPGGKRFAAMSMGPVVGFDIPEIKGSVKLKVLIPVYARNSVANTLVYLGFTKAFK